MNTRRVLLHNHSTWSDGAMSLDTVARWGERLGASAVVMSDHDYYFTPMKWDDYVSACQRASTTKCSVIPGVEYSSPNDRLHIVTMGTPRFHGARRDILETLSAVRADGGANILAHPTRKNAFDLITSNLLPLLDAIEIWNRKVDGLSPIKQYFQFAHSRGLATTVGMDLHTRRQIFPMWNEIELPPTLLDGHTIAAAIRSREIVPACIFGRLQPSSHATSLASTKFLTGAEKLRRLLRDVRDVVMRSN
jgi:predicted metal-dependent phosphoesterase TrpH